MDITAIVQARDDGGLEPDWWGLERYFEVDSLGSH